MSKNGGSNVWQNISDMMTGLMLIFMFITVLYLTRVESKQAAIEEVAQAYIEAETQLNSDLITEFTSDLERWGAEILPDNTIRFNNPGLLFAQGSSRINPKFKTILQDFFPRYMEVLADYQDEIEELRIEGHTSSVWKGTSSLNVRYLKNVELSQNRAFSILEYVFALKKNQPYQDWLTRVFRANGLAFSNPVYDREGNEAPELSRRVEFRIKNKADEKIRRILDKIDQ